MLSLPPLYRAVVLAGDDKDAQSHAGRLARGGAAAGTFVWRPDADRLDCAVVLRPEETGERVLPVVLVAALALSDAIGAVGPPAIASDLVWPGSVRVNGGLVGDLAVDLDPGAGLRRIPDWAVVAADIRITPDVRVEGGERPDVTCLEAEGFVGGSTRALTEAFARYLLVWMDRWDEQGLSPIARHWLHRATAQDKETVFLLGDELVAGAIERLDAAGGLHLATRSGRRKLTLEAWWRAAR